MTRQAVTFTVRGIPQPQGSKRLVGVSAGHPRMIEDNRKLEAWRHDVGMAALAVKTGPPWDCPVELDCRFVFPRPKRPKCKDVPCVKPDGDKLLRAVADALSTVLYRDDALIVDWHATKRYGPPGQVGGAGLAIITVRPATVTWP